MSIGIVAVAVLTSASASSAPRTGSAEPAQQAPTAALLPAATAVSAPSDATWTAPDADLPWLGPAIDAELARIAAERAEAERVAAEAAQAAADAAAQAAAEHEAAVRKATREAARRPGAVPSSVPVGDVKEYAASLVAADQWGCLDALFQRESGWNPAAMNKSSGAFGIPQALPGSKMASAGADWQTNPLTQVRWGVSYINGRYGSPCGAWAHSESHGWY
ncbi:transglycosylase SLT domain-containing protein [Cellulomonas sp. Root485]|uniref:aggregation-promoting factor C-terminal-like domain-containing protein n=1 Tax=Cellulomonas sp. Root485 TaxID=1736546 RepID=UPI001F41EEE6|nr:transglycosylase SLT domain-containing protein [Cellulomonas sp. Root485]